MSEHRLILGIDPGQSGGIAIVSLDGGFAEAWKMPDTEADLCALIREHALLSTMAWLEKVHAMPRNGVSSMFTFGTNYGLLRGILIALNIRRSDVTPQAWQKHLGCLTHGDKNVSKARAQELFPRLKINHAIADALLIAEYGRRKELGI